MMPDGTAVDYNGLIPNNVGLSDDQRVRDRGRMGVETSFWDQRAGLANDFER